MDAPPRKDVHVQHASLLRSSSRPRSQRLKPYKAPGRTALLLILGGFHVACNIAILFVAFRGYRFGNRIGKDSWWITDNSMLAVIQPCSNLLFAITALLGGWAMSHLWSRRLSSRSAAGLAEMQSFQIYGSIPKIVSSIVHIFSGHYISAQWLYAAAITSAILLQFYTTAIVTLITPSATIVSHPWANYSYVGAPFMSSASYGLDRCVSEQAVLGVIYPCLEIVLSGTALSDIAHFDGANPWSMKDPSWVEVSTTYTIPISFVSATLPLGPIRNSDFSNGAQLYGINLATVERISRQHNFWDSFSFSIEVSTVVPLLTCQCTRQGPANTNITRISILGIWYTLSEPVPPLMEGQIMAQVTPDSATLIISIHSSRQPGNVHCAIKLWLADSPLTIFGANNTGPSSPSRTGGTLFVYPDTRYHSEWKPYPMSIREFSDVWLQGLGLGSTPTQGAKAVVDYLGGMPVGTGGQELIVRSQSLESYMLVMLSNGIGAAFAEEKLPLDASNSSKVSNRTYTFNKVEYSIGITSKWKSFYAGIILLDSIFVMLCIITILYLGWLPDFTDPVTFARAAVYSGSGFLSPQRAQDGDEKSLFPPKSPVPLVNGEDEDKKLWKECFTLREVVDGNRRVLVFEPTILTDSDDLD